MSRRRAVDQEHAQLRSARRIRVRLNFVRGKTGTPKSKRSSRSVPLADSLGGELDLLHRATAYQSDDDLVFAHPHTGKPIDRSKLLKRHKAALECRPSRRAMGTHEQISIHMAQGPASVSGPINCVPSPQGASLPGPPVKAIVGTDGTETIPSSNTGAGTWHMAACYLHNGTGNTGSGNTGDG